MYFLFFFIYISLLYLRSCEHLFTYIVLYFHIIHLPLHVLFLFYIYTHVSFGMQSLFLFTHDALMSFV